MPMLKTSSQTLRGGRMVKTARGIVSFAPMMAGVIILIGGASAADAQVVACANPVLNEMCDLQSSDPSLSNGIVNTFVSGDGQVITRTDNGAGLFRGHYWTAAHGWQQLSSVRADGTGDVFVNRSSYDGNVFAGFGATDSGTLRAIRWVGGIAEDLGSLRADKLGSSQATDISSDGNVVVGHAQDDSGDTRAFRWVDGIGMQDLGSVSGASSSAANSVSADGAVVTGTSADHAFRWDVKSDTMVDLGTLKADETGESYSYEVSGDGAVIVGFSSHDGGDLWRAFRWSLSDANDINSGVMTALASLGTVGAATNSMAVATTFDGSVIVGADTNDNGELRAVRWGDVYGIEDLGTLKSDNSGNSAAYGISHDGRTIVGVSEFDGGSTGEKRSFVLRTTMQDLTNVGLSLGSIVEDNAIAVAAQQDTVGQLAEEGFLVARGQNGFRVSGNLLSTGSDNGEGIASGTARSGFLSYGYGVSDQVTLGATIGIFGNSLGTDAVDADNGYGASLWAEFSQGGLDRTGWQGSAALAWGQQDATIARGLGFTNVTRATGEVELDTRVVHASLGFGVQSGNWLLTPSVGLTHFRSERSGYAETGSDTLASYDKLTMDRTTLTLALEGETRVSAAGRLSLGAGVEHDLSADRARVSGTSDVPGLTTFGFESGIDRNDTRGFVSIGYRHDINENSLVSFDLNVGQAQLGSGVQTGMRVGYQMRF